MEEKNLLSLLSRDPEAGIHALMEEYGGAIYTICKNFLYDCPDSDVEEAVADTFVHFWRSREQFSPEEYPLPGYSSTEKSSPSGCSSPEEPSLSEKQTATDKRLKSYLYTIARNAAIDKRRRAKRHDFFPLEEVSIDLPSGDNVESDFVEKRNAEILHECLGKMKEPDRSVFLYRYFYGFQVKEIASMMNLATKKIENTLYLGKRKLRTALLEGGICYDDQNR